MCCSPHSPCALCCCQWCPTLLWPLLTKHLIHYNGFKLCTCYQYHLEMWCCGQWNRSLSQEDPPSAWCERGEGCTIFINTYFVSDLEHASMHKQLPLFPSGACAAQQQWELVINWTAVESKLPACVPEMSPPSCRWLSCQHQHRRVNLLHECVCIHARQGCTAFTHKKSHMSPSSHVRAAHVHACTGELVSSVMN